MSKSLCMPSFDPALLALLAAASRHVPLKRSAGAIAIKSGDAPPRST